MGAFFLLAGYFTPAALDAKGTLRYLRDRALRLGIPLAVFGWLLGPVTVALAKTQQGQPFVDSLLALLRRGAFVIGPLWFAWALLIFGVGAVVWRALIPKGEVIAEPKQRPFPSNTTLVVVAVATGSLAFALRLVWPVGSEAFGLQLGYFASYTVLFVAGCSAAGQRWLEQIPLAPARTWRRVALLALPILPVVVLLGPALPAFRGEAAGGWNPVAIVYAFWEPFVAWGAILTLLFAFQRRYTALNRLWQSLAERAYAIYIIHPPVLVGVALAWRTIYAPALVKFAVTGMATCAICFVLAGWLLRLTGAKRVL